MMCWYGRRQRAAEHSVRAGHGPAALQRGGAAVRARPRLHAAAARRQDRRRGARRQPQRRSALKLLCFLIFEISKYEPMNRLVAS